MLQHKNTLLIFRNIRDGVLKMSLKKCLMVGLMAGVMAACCASSGDIDVNDNYVVTTGSGSAYVGVLAKGSSVPDRVYFALNSYAINGDSAKVLNEQAKFLRSNSDVKVLVEGRCDERGTREYNLALGERRATAVKNYLVKRGVSADRIKTISYGKERPVVVGSGEAVWAKNRVVISVVGKR